MLALLSISTSEKASNNHLFNSTVCHGLCPADSFPFYFKRNSFVRGNTLVIGMKIRLDLLPNLLLRIKFLLRISCFKTKNNQIAHNTEGRARALYMYTFVTAHTASLHILLREKNITCDTQNENFNWN